MRFRFGKGKRIWLNQCQVNAQYREAALSLLYRWSYTKPEEVAKILPAVADPEVQSAAPPHLARFWRQRDPAGYQTWIAALSLRPIRHTAMEQRQSMPAIGIFG